MLVDISKNLAETISGHLAFLWISLFYRIYPALGRMNLLPKFSFVFLSSHPKNDRRNFFIVWFLVRISFSYIYFTAWKLSVFQVFLVRIFPHLYWIQRDIPYNSVFSPNAGIYQSEKLRTQTLFTQCPVQRHTLNSAKYLCRIVLWK